MKVTHSFLVCCLVCCLALAAGRDSAENWAGRAKMMAKLKARIAEANRREADAPLPMTGASSLPKELNGEGDDVSGPDYRTPTVPSAAGAGATSGCSGNPMIDEVDKLALKTIGCNPEGAVDQARADLARVTQEITDEKIKKVQEEMGAAGAAMSRRDSKRPEVFDANAVVEKYFPTNGAAASSAADGADAPALTAVGAGEGTMAPAGDAGDAAPAAAANVADNVGGAAAAGGANDPEFENLMTAAGFDGNHAGSGSGSGSTFVEESDQDVHGDFKDQIVQAGKESVATGGAE